MAERRIRFEELPVGTSFKWNKNEFSKTGHNRAKRLSDDIEFIFRPGDIVLYDGPDFSGGSTINYKRFTTI